MAIDPGDWRKVHTIHRHETVDGVKLPITEEGISCWNCNKFLLASPDDDIDPIKQGAEYDVNIYHKFTRPDGWVAPRQNILKRAPKNEDWVVVWEPYIYVKNDIDHQLDGAEGKVVKIDDGMAQVELAGFSGIYKNEATPIPVKHLRVMYFDTIVAKCPVVIIRGKYRDCHGIVLSSEGGKLTVQIEAEPHSITAILPLEHVHRTSFE